MFKYYSGTTVNGYYIEDMDSVFSDRTYYSSENTDYFGRPTYAVKDNEKTDAMVLFNRNEPWEPIYVVPISNMWDMSREEYVEAVDKCYTEYLEREESYDR